MFTELFTDIFILKVENCLDVDKIYLEFIKEILKNHLATTACFIYLQDHFGEIIKHIL